MSYVYLNTPNIICVNFGLKRRHRTMKLNILGLLETAFERLGRFIARWPFVIIISCLVLSGLCCIGFINVSFSTNTYDIWDTNPKRDPEGSQSVIHKEWVSNNFGDNLHVHTLIFSTTDPDGNILNPNALKVMLDIHKAITMPKEGFSFEDICHR